MKDQSTTKYKQTVMVRTRAIEEEEEQDEEGVDDDEEGVDDDDVDDEGEIGSRGQ